MTPFLLSPGNINVSLGDQLAAASGPFVKIADFLNEKFLGPMEPVADILETEFSIAGLDLLGAGKLHNIIDLGKGGTPNGKVTEWVNLYNGINSVVDSVAAIGNSGQISVPTTTFYPTKNHGQLGEVPAKKHRNLGVATPNKIPTKKHRRVGIATASKVPAKNIGHLGSSISLISIMQQIRKSQNARRNKPNKPEWGLRMYQSQVLSMVHWRDQYQAVAQLKKWDQQSQTLAKLQ